MNAILKTFEVELKLLGAFLRQLVNAPVLMFANLDHAVLLQIVQVLGDFDLRRIEQLLEVADAQGAAREKMQDAEASLIAKTLIDLYQIHRTSIFLDKNMPQEES